MTKQEIQSTIIEILAAQKEQEKRWLSWIKLIIPFIIIPAMSVYSAHEIVKYRLLKAEEKLENKVDVNLYDQYIIKQIELQKLYNENTTRIEKEAKERDEKLENKIDEIKQFLNEVYKDKKIWIRGENKLLYNG